MLIRTLTAAALMSACAIASACPGMNKGPGYQSVDAGPNLAVSDERSPVTKEPLDRKIEKAIDEAAPIADGAENG